MIRVLEIYGVLYFVVGGFTLINAAADVFNEWLDSREDDE